MQPNVVQFLLLYETSPTKSRDHFEGAKAK